MAFGWLAGRRVLFIRHGNTGKATNDQDRQITELGERQAAKFRASYSEEIASVRFAFCSPVARTVTTAALLLMGSELSATPIADLYFGNIVTDEHRAVDRVIGYAPVQTYLASHADLYQQPAKQMASALDAAGSEVRGEGSVLVVGHAMYLSLLTLQVIEALTGTTLTTEAAATGIDLVKGANLSEVEGFEISAEGGVRCLRNQMDDAALGPNTGATKCNDDFVTG